MHPEVSITSHLYRRRADIMGGRHEVPGVGSLLPYLTPPGWEPGQEPISHDRALRLFDESRDRAVRILDEEAQQDRQYRGWELLRRQTDREEAHTRSRFLDEAILRERIAVYDEWTATNRRTSPCPDHPPYQAHLNGALPAKSGSGKAQNPGLISNSAHNIQGGKKEGYENERRSTAVPRSPSSSTTELVPAQNRSIHRSSSTITLDSERTVSFESEASAPVLDNKLAQRHEVSAGSFNLLPIAAPQQPLGGLARGSSAQPPVFHFASPNRFVNGHNTPARSTTENVMSRPEINPPSPSQKLPPMRPSPGTRPLPSLANLLREGPHSRQGMDSKNTASTQNMSMERTTQAKPDNVHESISVSFSTGQRRPRESSPSQSTEGTPTPRRKKKKTAEESTIAEKEREEREAWLRQAVAEAQDVLGSPPPSTAISKSDVETLTSGIC